MSTSTYTRAELLAAGLIVNPHMWLGSGWMYCPTCTAYRYHYAMSHRGLADCFEVCRVCDQYTGTQTLPALAEQQERDRFEAEMDATVTK